MSNTAEIRCICGELILKSYDDCGKTKIRASIVIVDREGITKAVCRRCGVEHVMPLVLDEDLSKSIQEKAKEHCAILRKRFAEASPPSIVIRKKSKKSV